MKRMEVKMTRTEHKDWCNGNHDELVNVQLYPHLTQKNVKAMEDKRQKVDVVVFGLWFAGHKVEVKHECPRGTASQFNDWTDWTIIPKRELVQRLKEVWAD